MAPVVQSEGALLSAHRPMSSIGRGLELYSGRNQTYAELYLHQPNVRLVNGFLARNIAQLGIHAFERVSDDERQRLDPKNGLSRVLRRPNPYTTRYAFIDAMIHDLGIYDLFVGLKVRNPATRRLHLFRIPPHMVEPIGDSWMVPDGIRLLGYGHLEFPWEQVVWIHGYHPIDPRIGASPLEALRRVLAEEAVAGEWREQFLRRGARISGVIERPVEAPKWSETARARFRSDFQATWAGNGDLAGATPILEEGMTWNNASFSPQDIEYLGARILARAEVAAAYHVSPLFVGILENANFSNVAEQHKHLYQDTLGPRCVNVEEELELQLVPDFADELDPDLVYLEFNLAEKLKGTFEEQAKTMQVMTGRPVMAVNEGRARLNLAPIEGGEGLVIPLNVLIGGQASPRDTAPPPGLAARGRKAAGDLPADVAGWHAKHLEVLADFFDRQKTTVMAGLEGGQTVAEAWDDATWDADLEVDLFALSLGVTADVASATAARFGGTYDDALALAYLQESSRIAAENINATTKAAAAQAFRRPVPATASRSKAADDAAEAEQDPLEAVAGIFTVAAAARADEIAVSRVTAIGNFARHEGAAQAGVPSKVWVVMSPNPRANHPATGETVPMASNFSNGARWPGDPAAGVDQTAGCTCSLSFSTEAP